VKAVHLHPHERGEKRKRNAASPPRRGASFRGEKRGEKQRRKRHFCSLIVKCEEKKGRKKTCG